MGSGGDGNPLTTRAINTQGDGGGAEERTGRPRMAQLRRPQRGTAADIDSAGNPPNNEGQIPPEWSCVRHTYGSHRGGTPHPAARAHGAQPGTWGGGQTRQHALLVRG